MERIHHPPAIGLKGTMHRRGLGPARIDPETRGLAAKAANPDPARMLQGNKMQTRGPKRCQGGFIKRPGTVKIRYTNAKMINHVPAP